MTSLMHYNPVDGLLRQFFGGTPTTWDSTGHTQLRPRVDIHELEDRFVIEADLPGVRKDELRVELEGDSLVLRARRESDSKDEKGMIRRERHSSVEYVRSFHIGDEVDADGISAELRDGVLTLSVPKREKVLPRRIEVK